MDALDLEMLPLDGGYRVAVTDTRWIDVRETLGGYRLCETPRSQPEGTYTRWWDYVDLRTALHAVRHWGLIHQYSLVMEPDGWEVCWHTRPDAPSTPGVPDRRMARWRSAPVAAGALVWYVLPFSTMRTAVGLVYAGGRVTDAPACMADLVGQSESLVRFRLALRGAIEHWPERART